MLKTLRITAIRLKIKKTGNFEFWNSRNYETVINTEMCNFEIGVVLKQLHKWKNLLRKHFELPTYHQK